MSTSRRTVIRFDYGGYYTNKVDGSSLWNPKEANKTYAIFFSTSKKKVTYFEVVCKVCSKMGVDQTSQLMFSYMSEEVCPPSASYIKDDDDVYLYLVEGSRTGVMHVEVVEEREQVRLEEDVATDIDITPRANVVPTILSPMDDGEDVAIDNGDVAIDNGDVAIDNRNVEILALDNCEDNENRNNEILPLDNGEEDNNDVENEEARATSDGEGEENIGCSWEDGLQFELGQDFESKEVVLALIERDCHQSRFDIATVNSNKRLYVVKCRQFDKGCKWALRVAKITNMECFSVRTYNKEHTCSRVASSTSRVIRKGTPRLVASLLREDYPGVLDTPTPKSLIGLIQGKLGVRVSYSTALRGEKQAANVVRGSPEESYSMLHSYLYMLEKVNLGTKTRVELHDDKKFKYVFVALGACVEEFKAMRKVIIVDDCHLKTTYKGVLIFATAQDPNHHHYLIVFGVVDGEKDDSWTWFMEMLKTVIPDDPELVFISDRNQSIGNSIVEVYPLAKHGFCIYHLSKNVQDNSKVRYKRSLVGERFRVVARAYSEVEFLRLYGAFRSKYPDAGEYLDSCVVEGRWARCYFPGERYNIDTKNAAEGLNSVFKEARKLSLLPMFDAIVAKISEWFNTHRKESSRGSSEHIMVPFVENELHDMIELASKLKVCELNDQTLEYDVTGKDGLRYDVNLREKTCTCGRFTIDRYACVHAIAAAMACVHAIAAAMDNKEREIPIYGLCSKYYSMELWVLTYYRTIYHVPGGGRRMTPHSDENKGISLVMMLLLQTDFLFYVFRDNYL